MKTVKQTNIEGGVDEMEVVDARKVKRRNSNVTMKTLKAWIEQTQKICKDVELTTPEESKELARICAVVKNKFINNKF